MGSECTAHNTLISGYLKRFFFIWANISAPLLLQINEQIDAAIGYRIDRGILTIEGSMI